jgi:hypothetical protein
MDIQAFWTGLTEPQASLVSSATTILSALIVAILGPLIFRGAVKGIEDARDKAKEAADSIKEKFDELTDQLSSVTESLANVQNRVEEVVVAESSQATTSETDPAAEARREKIKSEWNRLQRQVESLASASWIHGQTKLRYTRIDRRNYIDLLKAMDQDGNLAGSLVDWEAALNAWYTFRARNTPAPSPTDVESMVALRLKLEAAMEAQRQIRESALKRERDDRKAKPRRKNSDAPATASPE